jgi:hypothetical protein
VEKKERKSWEEVGRCSRREDNLRARKVMKWGSAGQISQCAPSTLLENGFLSFDYPSAEVNVRASCKCNATLGSGIGTSDANVN